MARDKGTDRDQLSAEIAALQSETALQLRQRWKALVRSGPVRGRAGGQPSFSSLQKYGNGTAASTAAAATRSN
jgi:hypothetical protein